MTKKSWISIKKINKDTYVLSEPNMYYKTHAYLLLGTKEALLIDTLTGLYDILEVVKKITELPIKVIITHAHYDHFNGLFDTSYPLYIHKLDAHWLTKYYMSDEEVRDEMSLNNQKFPKDFDIKSYSVRQYKNINYVEDGVIIDIGDRKIKIIHTPGHSEGSICLYDEKYKFLYSGDLIYKGELECFYEGTDPRKYEKSLEKISKLEVEKVYPGHGPLRIKGVFIEQVLKAFNELKTNSNDFKIKGIYKYDSFSIHI